MKWMRYLKGISCVFVTIVCLGCAHTLPKTSASFDAPQAGKGLVVGMGGFYDVNGFDYSLELYRAVQRTGGFAEVREIADLRDPLCDIIVTGNFSYSSVKTHNAFFYTSIYFFLIPALSGLPTSYIDGEFSASFEVYQSGKLFKTLQYENVFREPRSYLTLYPSSTRISSQMARIAGHLAADLRDLGL